MLIEIDPESVASVIFFNSETPFLGIIIPFSKFGFLLKPVRSLSTRANL